MTTRSQVRKFIRKAFAVAAASLVSTVALSQTSPEETPVQQSPVTQSISTDIQTAASQITLPETMSDSNSDPALLPVIVNPALLTLPLSDADKIKAASCEPIINPMGKNHVAVIVNVTTGKMISDQCDNIDAQWAPASLTKLMSIATAFELMRQSNGTITGDTPFKISQDVAHETSIMKVGYARNEKVSVKNLIQAMMVLSANDAAKALAQGFSGNEAAFAEKMNATAQKLGMKNSHFVNASGWPPPDGQVQLTTARDMALLINAINNNYPEYSEWVEVKQAFHKKKPFAPHDHIRTDPSVKAQTEFGLDVSMAKSGHIDDAKYNLATRIKAKAEEWITVVLGASDAPHREATTKSLIKEALSRWASDIRDVIEIKPIVEEKLTKKKPVRPASSLKKTKADAKALTASAPAAG